ncbi:MAG: hypothetical protein DRN12_00985 [Thermoplasmata archaeon]|nr:MAG: hypothetical protein DRN12_00985 [Thermoplasmata archaeon]
MSYNSSFLFLSTVILISLYINPVFSQPFLDNAKILFDCTNTGGLIKPFSEINCGPLPVYYNHKPSVDITQQYQDIGINFIRTHDFFGPTDIHTIFPDWNADPFDENSYNFTSSDEVIASIINAGCKVFYRLGESASQDENLRNPPKNFSKWAEICKHIVMHYNDGWANGYHYNITYWEIWNEPDLNGFWNGTAEEYYHLYQITAEALKTYNPSLKIGGPCTSSITNVNYTIGFLVYILENKIPIDFFSWHCYATTPQELYINSLAVRSMLDSFGLYNCENILTEWNINLLTPQRDKENAYNAAFTASSIILFQDASLDYAFRYRGTQDNSWLLKFIGFDISLFTADGKYKTPALTYKIMHYITRDTPIRLLSNSNSSNLQYLSGISQDKTNISILLSNFDSPDTIYSLNISNIPWNDSYKAVYYLIDDNHHLEITEENTYHSKEFHITKSIKHGTVQFIRLTNSSVYPEEGPPVASLPFIFRSPLFDPIAAILRILVILFLLS